MKLGNEVEGRFKGLPTLFLDANEFLYWDLMTVATKVLEDYGDGDVLMRTARVKQIYVSDRDNILTGKEEAWDKWEGIMITVEVTQVTDRDIYPEGTNVMLAIDDSPISIPSLSFTNLLDTDQVKFTDNRGGSVWCVTKENMARTVPSDFDHDITLFKE